MDKNRTKNTKNTFFQRTAVVIIGAMICCFLWGSAFPGIKLGYQFLQIQSSQTGLQIAYAGVRFTLAGILALLFGSLAQRNVLVPRRQAIPKIMVLSLFQTILQYLFFYIGLAHTTGVKASIIEGVNVFVAIFVASVLFRQEKMTARKMVGSLVGFAGVVLVNLSGGKLDVNLTFIGEGFIFLSTVSYALSSVFLKRYSKDDHPVMLSGYQFCFGGIVMFISGWLFDKESLIHVWNSGILQTENGKKGIWMLVYLAFVSAVAYSLWAVLLKYNSVSKVSVFGFMNPVFGVILSAILLKETSAIGSYSMVALVLVCVGIYIVNAKKNVE